MTIDGSTSGFEMPLYPWSGNWLAGETLMTLQTSPNASTWSSWTAGKIGGTLAGL